MWELYDRLIEGIDEGPRIVSVTVGQCWTAVLSEDGSVGLAMTTQLQSMPRCREDFLGLSLKEASLYIKSWNFIEAGIGMAAINAWYNSPTHLAKLNCRQGDNRYCTFDIPVEGKRVVKVGHMRKNHEPFKTAAQVITLERDPKKNEYPDSACEYVIPESDIVIITGSAFVNKTMPRLLELAKGKTVIITGPSAPMSHTLLDFGVRRVAGLVVTDTVGIMDFVGSDLHSPPYAFGERYCIERTI